MAKLAKLMSASGSQLLNSYTKEEIIDLLAKFRTGFLSKTIL